MSNVQTINLTIPVYKSVHKALQYVLIASNIQTNNSIIQAYKSDDKEPQNVLSVSNVQTIKVFNAKYKIVDVNSLHKLHFILEKFVECVIMSRTFSIFAAQNKLL